jgi:hypothetical protein
MKMLISSHVLWTDKSHFTQMGIVSTHNIHPWAHDNLHFMRKRDCQVCWSLDLWAGLLGDSIKSLYLLPECFTAATKDVFVDETLPVLLEDVALAIREHMWCQNNNEPPHYRHHAHNLTDNNFQGRWISRVGQVH